MLALLRRARLAFKLSNIHVRTVLKNFVPVFISRGVVQISAFVDAWLASPDHRRILSFYYPGTTLELLADAPGERGRPVFASAEVGHAE